jgi:hypothetical protein
VVGAERLLVDRECALVQRLGFGVAALVAIELGEVVEFCTDLRVMGTESTFGLSSLSSISRPPRRLASKSRGHCSPAPTR